jgi:N-acetyl-gamma-glutamyl-phosphate reductase
MIKTCVLGASGYTGAELANLLSQHSQFELCGLYVSAQSKDANKSLADIYGGLSERVELPLIPLSDELLHTLPQQMDVIFLATPHEASHEWMDILCAGKAVVMDLSGAFRLKDKDVFAKFYGFEHTQGQLLQDAVYGLADWNSEQIKQAKLVAVPGCYPTASLTALLPLHKNGLLDANHRPIINAVSGVSGAGRKANLGSSFCEVSLQAYGVLGHKHQPEIAAHLGCEVIFTPHLGNFKRGILATITAKLAAGVTAAQVEDTFVKAYANTPIVRIRKGFPRLQDVLNSPYCDLFWKFDPESGYVVVSSAIDNLLKGAASQAVQCANLRFGFDSHKDLLRSNAL